MTNEILKIIKDLTKEQVKKFKIDNSNELRQTCSVFLYAFLEANLCSVEDIASRLAVSVEKGSTTIEKIEKYVSNQLSIASRELLTFDSFQDFLKFRSENQNLKFGTSWQEGGKALVYKY